MPGRSIFSPASSCRRVGRAYPAPTRTCWPAWIAGPPDPPPGGGGGFFADGFALQAEDFSGLSDPNGDGVNDVSDNCTAVANNGNPGTGTAQLDADLDGYGNICDADLNNSGLVTTADFGILRSVLNQAAGSSPTAAAADLNGSGTVTTADFAILRARLNTAP